MVKVLMVAEKPSLAGSIAGFLSKNQHSSYKTRLDVHTWNGTFRGQAATFKMTSVIGHVFSIDFPNEFQGWDRTSPEVRQSKLHYASSTADYPP